MTITKSDYASLRQEWHYLSRLLDEARRLELDMDYHEGLAILDENPKHIAQTKRLKKMCRKRCERRYDALMAVYEEMGQEELDCAAIVGTPVRWPKERRLL